MFVCDVTQTGIVPVSSYDWNDGLFDITWAENNENLIVAGAGDGSLLLFDVKNPKVHCITIKNQNILTPEKNCFNYRQNRTIWFYHGSYK